MNKSDFELLPIESATLHEFIKVFIKVKQNVSFCIAEPQVSIKITTKAKIYFYNFPKYHATNCAAM